MSSTSIEIPETRGQQVYADVVAAAMVRRGRALGAFKRAAVLAGITFETYAARLRAGEKRCTKCKQWKHHTEFNVDVSRWDNLAATCADCNAETNRDKYAAIPLSEWKPIGPPRSEPRDGDKEQARHLINLDVQRGRRPHPDILHCSGCGHKGLDRRHEYHHHMGYAARHHYDVIPLCTTCHHEEH